MSNGSDASPDEAAIDRRRASGKRSRVRTPNHGGMPKLWLKRFLSAWAWRLGRRIEHDQSKSRSYCAPRAATKQVARFGLDRLQSRGRVSAFCKDDDRARNSRRRPKPARCGEPAARTGRTPTEQVGAMFGAPAMVWTSAARASRPRSVRLQETSPEGSLRRAWTIHGRCPHQQTGRHAALARANRAARRT